MKNKEIINLMYALKDCKNLKGTKFSYAVVKNNDILKKITDDILEKFPKSEGYLKYEEELDKLSEKYKEDNEKLQKEIEKLEKEHKKDIDFRNKQSEEYNIIMEEEATIELHKVKLEDIPEEITPRLLDGIKLIICE